MKTATVALLALLSTAGGGAPARGDEAEGRALYFFFSEKTPSAPEAAKAIAAFMSKAPPDLTLRPVLLVEDWSTFQKVGETSPLYLTMRELGKSTPLQVFDEEGLTLAQAWKITRLPAWALVSRGRAHVLQGAVSDLDRLLECTR